MSEIITIVGFSGAGKSVVGAKVAQLLGVPFVDLDLAIEEKYRTSIPILFSKYGEDVFRKCERKVLEESLLRERCVISTGGGTPCSSDAMRLINSCSTSVYLKLSEEILFNNLRKSRRRRPLTDKMEEAQLRQYIHDTLSRRAPFYEMAHHTICSSDGMFNAGEIAKVL